jgi:hypothetical protein
MIVSSLEAFDSSSLIDMLFKLIWVDTIRIVDRTISLDDRN